LKKFIQELAKYAPAQFLPALTAFITTPILTRLFPPSEYGYWALASSVGSFLVTLTASGLGSAVLRFYPAHKAKVTLPNFLTTLGISAAFIIALVSGFSFLALIMFRDKVSAPLYQLLPVTILIFMAQSVFTVFISIIRAQERGGTYTSFQLFTNYGALGLGLLLVLVFGLRINGLMWGTFIATTLALPYLIFLSTRQLNMHPQQFYLPDAAQMWQYAWPLTLGNVAMWALKLSDLFIIRFFWSEYEVGLYSVSYNLSAKSIELLVSLFMLSVSPLIYSVWETQGREATEKNLTMVTRVYLILCLPAAIGLSVLAHPFVALLTAPEYYEGARIVPFIVFSSFVWGLGFIANLGLTIKKQAVRLGINMLLSATIHLILQTLLVPRWGYMASAVSTLIGYTTFLVLNVVASRSHLAWYFPLSTLRNTLAASLAMGLAAYGVYSVSRAGAGVSIPYLFLSICAAVPVYAAGLWFLGEIKPGEKTAVWQLWAKVKEGQHG
jgi:O-antigen/teichoic acid export membrane protein